MADPGKRYTLRGDPKAVVTALDQPEKTNQYGLTRIAVKFENPGPERHGTTWIPKDQLKEMPALIKPTPPKKNLAGKVADKMAELRQARNAAGRSAAGRAPSIDHVETNLHIDNDEAVDVKSGHFPRVLKIGE